LYDYQAAADDEITFDPNDVITNIEMVSSFLFYNSCTFYVVLAVLSCVFNLSILCPPVHYRSMMVGGLASATGNLAFSPQIMSKWTRSNAADENRKKN
jgi:hypothetical protein